MLNKTKQTTKIAESVTVAVVIRADQAEWLEAQKKASDRSGSSLVRMALDLLMASKEAGHRDPLAA